MLIELFREDEAVHLFRDTFVALKVRERVCVSGMGGEAMHYSVYAEVRTDFLLWLKKACHSHLARHAIHCYPALR